MRVLCVVSSSNQLYSGIGRALFELTRRLADRIEYEFAIDGTYAQNVSLLTDFCEQHGFLLHVGRGAAVPDTLDALNLDLPALLSERRWDAVESLCWANTATNDAMLGELGETPLCYTPHHQPLWTVPMSAEQALRIESVHHRMLERADLVLCDSPWERLHLQDRVRNLGNCLFLPLGCHFDAFRPGVLERKEQLLFVGDLAEPRKRFDRVLAVFAMLRQRRPNLKLMVVGNRSERVRDHIPGFLRPACELLGYVSEAELQQAYAESQGLFLLSEFEAFGIPILEALVCGTPVFLTDIDATRSLFGRFRGAHFCPGDDLEGTFAIVEQTLERGRESIREVLADRVRLQATFDWDILAATKWQALAAAWFRKRHCA
jgi:glycosyltransferase involved in cell wall biosynthesis